MQHRRFLARASQTLAALVSAPGLARTSARTPASATLNLQDGRIAGSQHYDCDAELDRLRVGDPLRLSRQPGNRRDPRTIEMFWRAHKLAYLPRRDNAAAASLLDHADDERKPMQLRLWIPTHAFRESIHGNHQHG